jgi:hypothetical protein
MIDSSKLKILSDVVRLGDLVIMKNNKNFDLFYRKIVFSIKMAITFAYELEQKV